MSHDHIAGSNEEHIEVECSLKLTADLEFFAIADANNFLWSFAFDLHERASEKMEIRINARRLG